MHPAKATIVEDLQTKLNASPFLFVADYTGLKVDQFAELRNRLWNAGARCHVVKNTFLRRAAKDAGLPELGDLKGQTAIVVGDKDVAAAAKVLKTFTAEFKKPEVKTGVVDKLVVSTEQIKAIADLPSREVLLATLLGVAQRPGDQARPRAQRARLLARPRAQGQGREGRCCRSGPAAAEASDPAAAELPAAADGHPPPSSTTFSRCQPGKPRPPQLAAAALKQPTNGSSSGRRLPV